jgi:integrase
VGKSDGKDFKGVHRVSKTLADGIVRKYHYAFRGGPCFWTSEDAHKPGDPEYAIAFADALKGVAPTITKAPGKSTESVVDSYRSSAHFKKLAPRTRSDYAKYLEAFVQEFGEDPIALFEETASLGEIREWKNRWASSPKQYDYATSVVTRLLNWAVKEEAALAVHHHKEVERLYHSDRADIIWLPDEVQALIDVANVREKRIVIAASEGGLTPQDIGILKQEHVQRTPRGRRLFFRRTKTGKPVSIPVTPALDELIDSTPADQEYLIVSLEGHVLTPRRASQIVRDLKERANASGSGQLVRTELRLYDLRGTAATALLRADCSLNQIAVTMGWGIRHAANIIEKYAALVPEGADEVLRKLNAARKKANKQ